MTADVGNGQQDSADLARHVFTDPTQRAAFEAMAKETERRKPTRDDFASWLPERYATPATDASFRWHYLDRGSRKALCGETHRRWEPLSWFARPNVFEPCVECQRRSVEAS